MRAGVSESVRLHWIVMSYIVIIILVLFGIYALRRPIFRGLLGAIKKHPEYAVQMDRVSRSYAAEASLVEEAEWFGKTGLSGEDEREPPKYLRREFGELLLDGGALKASDLEYLGSFDEPDAHVHYWSVPSSDGRPIYAYIEVMADQICTGWGNRVPPDNRHPGFPLA